MLSRCAALLLLFLLGCAGDQNNGNRLAASRSPYLREHSDNPVNWYEWGAEALSKAKAENKPLIISVGYSSCHWCHVMERESFMDTAIARIMNEHFVSIKVDREERPDIDQVYINAAQLLSGNAGWPLNAFALPDGSPFYAGTYYTNKQWRSLLNQVKEGYDVEYQDLVKQATAIKERIKQDNELFATDSVSVDEAPIAIPNLLSYVDPVNGGLIGVPKFPMASVWEFCLAESQLQPADNDLRAVTKTLDAMAGGGIYDHLAGGFARYATDERWLIPHFEKMLYDNAQLVSLYAHAFQRTGQPGYRRILVETLDFINNELTSPDGAFYSSINADSEGQEGKYYVWSMEEWKSVLGSASGISENMADHFHISPEGNWDKTNILFIDQQRVHSQSTQVEDAVRLLLKARERRVRPSTDNKIITSWNGMMIGGFVDAYRATPNELYLKAALRCANFMEKNMTSNDGELGRVYFEGEVGSNSHGFLDDYAWLALSFIKLYEVTFDLHWLQQARLLTDYAIQHFRNPASHLFYYSSDDVQSPVARATEIFDNAVPSSNSVFAEILLLLGEYYDETNYGELGASAIKQALTNAEANAVYLSNWLRLAAIRQHGFTQVAVVGKNSVATARQIQQHY